MLIQKLKADIADADKEIEVLNARQGDLKTQLKATFGDNINLER